MYRGLWVLGGSICRILRGLEAPGGPNSNHAVKPGGCPFKEPKILGLGAREIEASSFGRLEVTNVSRIVALGGSMCRNLRRLEVPGRTRFRGLNVPGGSA